MARAELEQARLHCDRHRSWRHSTRGRPWAELLAARATWEASAGTIQQATRAFQIAEVRFREGVSTQLELSDSRLLLQQSQANRAQAARDLQVARARMALLPDLPLGGFTTSRPQQPVP